MILVTVIVKLQAARRERERIITEQKSKRSGSERPSPHLMSRDFPTSRSWSMPPEWNQSSRATQQKNGRGLRSSTVAKGRGDLDIAGLPEKVGGRVGSLCIFLKGYIVLLHLIPSPPPPLPLPPYSLLLTSFSFPHSPSLPTSLSPSLPHRISVS